MWARLQNAFRTRPVVVGSRCSSCGERLDRHVQAEIGSAVLDTAEDKELRCLIESHEWTAAITHQAANATADIRSWRVLRCGDGRIAVVARVMPLEVWSDDYYEDPQFLSNDEASELLRFVALPQSTKA